MKRSDSAVLQLRKRIPRDVTERARGVLLNIPIGDRTVPVRITQRAAEVAVSLDTRDPAEAKRRQAGALAYLERVWEGLRKGPQTLTHKQVVALAGLAYREMADKLEDFPGEPAIWEHFIRVNRVAVQALGAEERPLRIDTRRAAAEQWFEPTVDAILAREGLNVDQDSRERLLVHTARALTDAGEKLKRNAEGDYRPDPAAERFPEWTAPASAPPPAKAADAKAETLTGLLAGWWAEAKAGGRSPSTHASYRSTVENLVAFLGHDYASRVTADDVIRFKDHRLAQGRSPKTVKDSDLTALKSVFGWAVSNRRLTANPAAGVTVRLGRRTVLRSKGFADGEATAILSAASAYRKGPQERPYTAAAKHWVPWLCAYTGARVGEVAQLRRQDVRREGALWVIRITPEAGTVKTGKARDVPLHPHLVALGFPAFVEAAPAGHLFLRPAADGDVLGPLQGLKNRLAEFARDIVPDRGVAPNHGWRHRFKTVGIEAGASERVLDAICGHAPRTEGEQYGDATLAAMNAAIGKLPWYDVE